ncbi:MAG: hypothetical protein ACOX3E_01280 [Desulfomonilia bacterium]
MTAFLAVERRILVTTKTSFGETLRPPDSVGEIDDQCPVFLLQGGQGEPLEVEHDPCPVRSSPDVNHALPGCRCRCKAHQQHKPG